MTRSHTRVILASTIVAKLAFIEAFKKSGMTRVALAERLGKVESEVRRMLEPYHRTKLDALEAGMKALGKRFRISVEDASSAEELA